MNEEKKNYFVSLNFLIVIIFHINWSCIAGFFYRDEGFWLLKYPQCAGQRQSPVSVEYKDLDERNSDALLSLINYFKKPSSVKLLNDGNTIKLKFVWDDNKPPYMVGEVLGENEYVLDSIQFHWSRVSNQGSEHILFGHGGAMEMHLMHYNRNYGSFENASNFNDGLAIVGALFNTNAQRRRRDSDYDNNYERLALAASLESPVVSHIINHFGSVSTPGSSVDIEPFAISEVRPVQVNQSAYISYSGSLSSPPCTENVIWLLSTYSYQITEGQLECLQSTVELINGDDHNNRPVQPMNGRKFAVVEAVG